LAIGVGVAASGSVEAPTQERDVQQLIGELKVGSVGALTLGIGFSRAMLGEGEEADGQIKADLAEIRRRADAGEATATDWLGLPSPDEGLADRSTYLDLRQRALEFYERELADKPDDPEVLVPFSRLLRDSGELERAEQLAARAVEIDPENLDAHEALIDSLTCQALPFSQWMQRMREELPEGLDIEGISPEALQDPTSEASARLAEILEQSAPVLHEAFLEMQKTPTVEQVAQYQTRLDTARAALKQARPLFLNRLNQEPTPAVFRQYAGIETSVAAAGFWSQYSRLRLLTATAEPPQPEQMMQPLFGVFSMEEMRKAGQRLCEAYPDDLGIRALVGSLQVMAVLSDVFVPLLQEGGKPPDTIPEEADLAIDNLTAALSLPLERRGGVVGGLALMYFVAGDHAAVLKVTDDAIQRGEWDPVAGSAALLATLGLMVSDMATMVHGDESPLDGPAPEEIRALEQRFAAWLDKTDPEDAGAFGNLAGIRARLDDWKGVAEALEHARGIESDHAVRACGLGVAYLKLGRHEEAAKVLAEALKLDFKGDEEAEVDCHHAYGVALLAVGKGEEAEKELEWEAEDEE
jgi:tetratricopeptide (TPR) repeat protein